MNVIEKLDVCHMEALQRWQWLYGRTWRSSLRRAWETGRYGACHDDAALLQQVRNIIGPSGLSRIGMLRRVHPAPGSPAGRGLDE